MGATGPVPAPATDAHAWAASGLKDILPGMDTAADRAIANLKPGGYCSSGRFRPPLSKSEETLRRPSPVRVKAAAGSMWR